VQGAWYGVTDVDFGLLGPVACWVDGRAVALGGPQQRAVLAVLLLEANQVVAIDRLVEVVWDGRPAPTAYRVVSGYVSRLRKILADAGAGEVSLTRAGNGYLLRVDPDRVDCHRFNRLVTRARTASRTGDRQAAVTGLREALALWRAETPLSDLESSRLYRMVVGLGEARLDAVEALAELDLPDNPNDWIDRLRDLADRYLEREHLAALAVDALTTAGRRNEGLQLYRQLGARIRDELDSEPTTVLRAAYQRALRDEPLTAPRAPAPVARTPAQLPRPMAAFTGRDEQVKLLDALLAADDRPPAAVVVTAIAGTAGVGKTALAVYWAHRVRDRFPDGQLYVDLRGYSHDPPVEASQALERFLHGLGVPGQQIPADLDTRIALYRTVMADKTMLVLLDNAATAEQVRPLLPGSPTCLVLVTSRDTLTGLLALDGATRLDLDVLTADESAELVTRILGESRVRGQADDVARLADRCARLPLALRIAAATMYGHPHQTIADYLADLAASPLATLAVDGDRHAAVRAHFDLSYTPLPSPARRLFRLLGRQPGTDIDRYAAAALAGTDLDQTRQLLDTLTDAHLLQQHTTGRYGFHDLLRAYATELADAHDDAAQDAIRRLLDHYLYTASTAADLLYPYERDRRPTIPAPATAHQPLTDQHQAADWLDTELPNLLSAADHAAGHDWARRTVQFAQILARHLDTRAQYAHAHRLHSRALRAAASLGDPLSELRALDRLGDIYYTWDRHGEALDHFRRALALARGLGRHAQAIQALNGIGHVYRGLGRHDEALAHYQQAQLLADEIGDRNSQAHVATGTAAVHMLLGNFDQAQKYYTEGLAHARDVGNLVAEGGALNGLGNALKRLGHHEQALDAYHRGLSVFRDQGNNRGIAFASNTLGTIYTLLGRYQQAFDYYDQGCALAREIGDYSSESYALTGLGNLHSAVGEHQAAIGHYQQALEIARTVGNRNSQFEALYGLGTVVRAAGEPRKALDLHQDAAAIAVDLGQRHDHARALDGLAATHHLLGQLDQAREYWQQALAIFAELGTPEAEAVRGHLADLAQSG
jgi:tetratricopeptide (TPR) repeat protein/DNA-binding SARP family transcriptional activator